MISISSYYGKSGSAENNAKMVTIDHTTLYFSYETLVAVDLGEGDGPKVIKNYWGPTTGRHMNEIDTGSPMAKDNRLEADDFQKYVNSLKLV